MADNPLSFLLHKLRARASIDAQAEAAILRLPYVARTYEAPAYLLREGAPQGNSCSLIVSGYAYRQKLTATGLRQIVSLHMRGDLLDLQHLFLKRTDHNVQALTRLEVLNIDRAALQELALTERSVGEALWIEALVDSSIYREWVVNVGRRDARARVAHLLCECATRMNMAGIGDGQSWHLPLTQEQIGDAVGLTSVHVNRTLKALESEGVIARNRREISFANWDRIRRIGDFSSLYLHLDQAGGGESPVA